MEIQTFLLLERVENIGPGNTCNGEGLGLHNFYPLDGVFPLRFKISYYMLLRRESRENDVPYTIVFRLVDQDGRAVGEPNNLTVKNVFPAGHRFASLHGPMGFVFPGKGDYRLDLVADEHKDGFIYQYAIEITG